MGSSAGRLVEAALRRRGWEGEGAPEPGGDPGRDGVGEDGAVVGWACRLRRWIASVEAFSRMWRLLCVRRCQSGEWVQGWGEMGRRERRCRIGWMWKHALGFRKGRHAFADIHSSDVRRRALLVCQFWYTEARRGGGDVRSRARVFFLPFGRTA